MGGHNRTEIVQTVVQVAANTVTQLVPQNTVRKSLSFINLGTYSATLGFTANAVLNAGWPLNAANSSHDVRMFEDHCVPQNKVTIVSPGAITVVVLEGQ